MPSLVEEVGGGKSWLVDCSFLPPGPNVGMEKNSFQQLKSRSSRPQEGGEMAPALGGGSRGGGGTSSEAP